MSITDSTLSLSKNDFILPSEGLPYDFHDKLKDGKAITLRPLVAGDQRALANQGRDAYSVLTAIVERTLIEPKIDIDDLLLSDANAAVFAVRVMSFGPDLPVEHKCGSCKNTTTSTINLLADLDVNYASGKPNFAVNEIEFKLTDGTKLEFRLARMNDEKMVASAIKRDKRHGTEGTETDKTYYRAAQCITYIEALDKDKKSAIHGSLKAKFDFLTEKMSWTDWDRLSEEMVEADTGVSRKVWFECSSCGNEEEGMIVFDENFFRTPRNTKSRK